MPYSIYPLFLHDALPICTRFSMTLAKACSASSSLKTSTLGRTPVRVLKRMVSSESIALPLGHPAIVLPLSRPKTETVIGSCGRSEEHTLNSSHLGISYAVLDLPSLPTRRSSDLHAVLHDPRESLLRVLELEDFHLGPHTGQGAKAHGVLRVDRAAARPPGDRLAAQQTEDRDRHRVVREIGRAHSELQSLRHLVCRTRSTLSSYTTLFRSARGSP